VRPYPHAVLGGTFDHLHVGHEALLTTAFQVGDRVSIGLTTERFLAEHPKPASDRLEPYAVRERHLKRWLSTRFSPRRFRTVPLENRFGRSVEDGVDVLIVSADTLEGGHAVNAERRRLGREPVPLVIVPVVLADDLGPVSSRRIRMREIDPRGRRLAPIKVGVAGPVKEDRDAVARAVRRVFSSARVAQLERPAAGARRPVARALARQAVQGRDLAVAVTRTREGMREIVERAPAFELPPRRVPSASLRELTRECLYLLRPDLERKAFGPRRPSSR
jgi:cytidyltransferase-like protein